MKDMDRMDCEREVEINEDPKHEKRKWRGAIRGKTH